MFHYNRMIEELRFLEKSIISKNIELCEENINFNDEVYRYYKKKKIIEEYISSDNIKRMINIIQCNNSNYDDKFLIGMLKLLENNKKLSDKQLETILKKYDNIR